LRDPKPPPAVHLDVVSCEEFVHFDPVEHALTSGGDSGVDRKYLKAPQEITQEKLQKTTT
jgi:hypothetical protein